MRWPPPQPSGGIFLADKARHQRESRLNRILIKCPNTGKMIYTGYSMDPQTFELSPIEEMDPVECPACHQTHRWTKRQALFERDPNE